MLPGDGMALNLRSKLYYLTPPDLPDTAALVSRVVAVLRGGVGMVQYRAKALPAARMYQDVVALLHVTRPAGVPLIVNDRVEVALAVGADGVHVGQADLPANVVRRMMGPAAIVGVTADEPRLARQAEKNGASYVACGTIFPSLTKPERPVIGVAGARAVQQAVSIPVCVIGGITAENLAQLRPVDPELVAVIAAINDALDPGQAAAELVELCRTQLPPRGLGL